MNDVANVTVDTSAIVSYYESERAQFAADKSCVLAHDVDETATDRVYVRHGKKQKRKLMSIAEFYESELAECEADKVTVLNDVDDAPTESFYTQALVALCAKKWKKATDLSELYSQQLEEDLEEVSSPRPLLKIADEIESHSPFTGVRKGPVPLVGSGSYDS